MDTVPPTTAHAAGTRITHHERRRRRRMAFGTITVLSLFLFAFTFPSLVVSDDPLTPGGNLENGNDDGDDEKSDEVDCPFDQAASVGGDDPNPCMTESCWKENAFIFTELDKCSIQTACCQIVLDYCALRPGDKECSEGSHHMNLFDSCAYKPKLQLGCPRITTSTTQTQTSTTKKPFTTTESTTTTRTTPPTLTSTTYTATTRTVSSRESTTTVTSTTTRCLGGDRVDPSTQITSVYWKCFSGNECVVQRFTCDGYQDCADGSDELYCGCKDGSCTPASTTTATTSTTTRTTSTTSTSTTSTATSTTVTVTTATTTTRTGTTTTRTDTSTTTTITTRTMSVITLANGAAQGSTTVTTKTDYHPENVDCVEQQDPCTIACEWSYQRNYKVLTPQGRRGTACAGPTDCSVYYKNISGVLFARRCDPPPTTTTATTVTTIPATVTTIPVLELRTTAYVLKGSTEIPVNDITGINEGDAVSIASKDSSVKFGQRILDLTTGNTDTTTVVATRAGLRRETAGFITVADALTNDYSVNSIVVITAVAAVAEAAVKTPTRPGMVVLGIVIAVLLLAVAYLILKELGYIPPDFWTRLRVWFVAKWAALKLCCCGAAENEDDDESDSAKDETTPPPAQKASEVAETEFDVLSKGLIKDGAKAKAKAKAKPPPSKFTRDSDDDESDEDGVEDFGPSKPDPQAAQLAAPLLLDDDDDDSDDEGALLAANRARVLLGGATVEGTTDEGSTVLYSDANTGGRFTIPMAEMEMENKPGLMLLGGVTAEGTEDTGETVLYDTASSSDVIAPTTRKTFVLAGSDVDYAIPMMPAKAGEEDSIGRRITKRQRNQSWVEDEEGPPPTLPTKAADIVVDDSAEDFYDLATLATDGTTGAIGGAGEQFYSMASPNSAADDGGDSSIYLTPGNAVNFDSQAEQSIYATPVDSVAAPPAGAALYDMASTAGPAGSNEGAFRAPPTHTPQPPPGEEMYSLAAGGAALQAQPPPGEELYSLATEGAALHVQGGGQFIIPMADDGGAAHAAEDSIYSTPVEAPAGEVLYDAASPGGPPPPLPSKGSNSVNPEPTYPQPPPGEELYSLATEGAALHVQGAGGGQFIIPMADDAGAAHAAEETIYSSALEAPPGEALYDAASAGDPTAYRAQAATGANFLIPMEDSTAATNAGAKKKAGKKK